MMEKELIHECICGNRVAQKELYEKYSSLLFAICMRYMPTREEAEDVLIMAFTSIFTKLDMFKEGSFEGWMKQIIVNTAISRLRVCQKRYETEITNEEWINNKGITPEKMIYSQIDRKYIMQQIQQLPDGYRAVFNLYVIDGYSYEDISDILNISIGTVRSQLSKARKTLQKTLQDFI